MLLVVGCPRPATVPIETDADTDTDADADTDADTDTDTDADADTHGTADTAATGFDTAPPTDSGVAETGLFAISCDTANPASNGTADCNGSCWPADYIGDGVFCDDGTVRPWGDPDFNCPQFGWDGGDCPAPVATGDTG